jgi:hypothetical protein
MNNFGLVNNPKLNNHNYVLVINKDMKIVNNVLQCRLCNSSRFHYLEPPRKGVIEKMTYFVEFWLIIESGILEHAPHEIFVVCMWKIYTTY